MTRKREGGLEGISCCLRKRREFLLLREEGGFFSSRGVAVQTLKREGGGCVRFGVTASRKVGNAVRRNRAKRRLRALWRDYERRMERGWDVNMIASRLTCDIRWKELERSFCYVMKRGGVWKKSEAQERKRRKDA